MRAHSNEHGDSLPVLDVSSLKHVAYVLDALVYYMRADTAAVNCQSLTPPILSESVETEPWIIDQVNIKTIIYIYVIALGFICYKLSLLADNIYYHYKYKKKVHFLG